MSFRTTQIPYLKVASDQSYLPDTFALDLTGAEMRLPESTDTPAGGGNIAVSQLYIEVGANLANLHFLDASGNTIYTWASSDTEAL